MSKVVYITSGKTGIPRFTYNELIELKRNNIDFTLCLTQLNEGPWMPQKKWSVILAKKGSAFNYFLLSLLKDPRLVISLLSFGARNKVLSYLFIAFSFFSKLKKDTQLTSIHCQMGDKKLYIGYFLKQLMNLPLTVTVHAHELYQRSVYDHNDAQRRLFASCDKIITVSEFNARLINDTLNDDPEKVDVIRLFPDIDYQKKVNNKTSILIVANWAEKKGYKVLFEAISKIQRNDFVLWVVGGSYFSDNSIDLGKLISKYDIKDKVSLLGRQGGVTLDIIFSACDIFCLPSYTEYYADGNPAEREGIPVALMEAMAWGKPVISTKHAGIPELVNEILVEEKNVLQLKDAIVFLLDNPEKRIELGRINKEIIAEKYSNTNVEQLANIFKEWV